MEGGCKAGKQACYLYSGLLEKSEIWGTSHPHWSYMCPAGNPGLREMVSDGLISRKCCVGGPGTGLSREKRDKQTLLYLFPYQTSGFFLHYLLEYVKNGGIPNSIFV